MQDTSPPRRRKLRPRAPVAIAAAMVSQLNCEALLGMDSRRYLDLLLPICKGAVVRLGKLRLIPLDVAVARLRALSTVAPVDAPVAGDGDDQDQDPQPESADAFLASIGRRRTA